MGRGRHSGIWKCLGHELWSTAPWWPVVGILRVGTALMRTRPASTRGFWGLEHICVGEGTGALWAPAYPQWLLAGLVSRQELRGLSRVTSSLRLWAWVGNLPSLSPGLACVLWCT